MEEKEYKYLVGVECMTFNQSKYILDALNGFVMQQTNFPFVVMVVDDASTDGEQEIIRQFVSEQFDLADTNVAYEKETDYAYITYAQHKINKNCYIAVLYLKENHYSQKRSEEKFKYLSEWRDYVKYEALCEGDDYWIDAQKLQKQVDFLEEHDEYGFLCHRYKIYEQNTSRYLQEYAYDYYKNNENLEITLDLFIRTFVTQLLTTMIRVDVYNTIKPLLSQYKYARDIHMYYHLLKKSKGLSLNEIMGVYRWNDGGVASTQKGIKRWSWMYETYKELYDLTKDSIFMPKLLTSIRKYLLFSRISKNSALMLRNGFLLTKSLKIRITFLFSFLFPVFLYEILVKLYSRYRLNRKTLL